MASDHGAIWRATLEHEGDRLIGFADWQAAALGHTAGDPAGRIDAEALADDAAGGLVVAVEGALPLRRIARDDPASAEPLPAADDLGEAGAGNAGIEALATLADGGLLALSEGVFAAPGQLAAWLIEDGRVTPLRYLVSDGFVPTGADRLDDTIYIVERRFSLLDGGFASRVVALDVEQIRRGGPLTSAPAGPTRQARDQREFRGDRRAPRSGRPDPDLPRLRRQFSAAAAHAAAAVLARRSVSEARPASQATRISHRAGEWLASAFDGSRPSVRRAIWERMSTIATKSMRQPVRRAEGLPAGCCGMPIHPWFLDPAHEVPGRRCPMPVLPPPQRSAIQRIAGAIFSLGLTIAAGASLMVLAQYLTIPG